MTKTPQEEAKNIINTFYYGLPNDGTQKGCKERMEDAIKCAKIAVNLVISTIPTKPSKTETERLDAIMYWLEVKQELEKL